MISKKCLSNLKKKLQAGKIKKAFQENQQPIQRTLIAILAVFILLSFVVIGKSHKKILAPPVVQNLEKKPEETLSDEDLVSAAINSIDTSGWQPYQNLWYGFELKYPKGWDKPAFKRALRGTNWEYRVLFRNNTRDEGNPYDGFDVVIYDGKATTSLMETEELTVKDNQQDKQEEKAVCDSIEGHLTENENFPAEEIYIDTNNNCFNPTYFFSLTRDQYIYNIVPSVAENEHGKDAKKEITKYFPEFSAVASSFELVDINRPKPRPPAPRITARKPVAAKNVGGRLVCAKKNDKPGKSNKGKGKHLDLECCLDPDEYPNPWCTY